MLEQNPKVLGKQKSFIGWSEKLGHCPHQIWMIDIVIRVYISFRYSNKLSKLRNSHRYGMWCLYTCSYCNPRNKNFPKHWQVVLDRTVEMTAAELLVYFMSKTPLPSMSNCCHYSCKALLCRCLPSIHVWWAMESWSLEDISKKQGSHEHLFREIGKMIPQSLKDWDWRPSLFPVYLRQLITREETSRSSFLHHLESRFVDG